MNKKIKRPRGIFPSLPSGMDIVIKSYFDTYRKKNLLPPELEGKVEGKLFSDELLLKKWRSWRATNLTYEDKKLGATLSGALDDCLVDNGFYVPLDYKTKGFEPTREQSYQFYKLQLDCYCLMLEENGYKTNGKAYLVYYFPKSVSAKGKVSFEVMPFEIKTDFNNSRKIFEEAVKLLKEPLPKTNPDCEYCSWLNKVEREKKRFKPGRFWLVIEMKQVNNRQNKTHQMKSQHSVKGKNQIKRAKYIEQLDRRAK